MVGKCVLLLFGVFLVVKSMKPTLDCKEVMPNGQFTGKIVGAISKEGWRKLNFLILKKGDKTPKCVDIDDIANPARAEAMWNAFKSNYTVNILVTGNHEATGLGLEKWN